MYVLKRIRSTLMSLSFQIKRNCGLTQLLNDITSNGLPLSGLLGVCDIFSEETHAEKAADSLVYCKMCCGL